MTRSTISTRRKSKVMNEKTETTTKSNQRGAAITELLFAIATLGAAVIAVAMTDPKIPPASGD